MEEEKVFYFEPSFKKVVETLQNPLSTICRTSESFIIMEKDLMPLMDVLKKPVFQAYNDRHIVE